jgi:spermidine synthase
MIPWEFIDSAHVPGNGGELSLHKRGAEFQIRVDGQELMNSRSHGSEEALAELACARVVHRPRPQILIGGLGMGYTLAATLQRLGPGSRVVVAELVPAVVTWNCGPLSDLAGQPLGDDRVTVRQVDVADLIKEKNRAYDAIVLDVDNGPEGLTRKANDWLYSRSGLDTIFSALRPAGVLAVWSASPSRSFVHRLHGVGFEVKEVAVRARGPQGGGRHTIWLAGRGTRKRNRLKEPRTNTKK